jgi:hypothetical protein
MGKAKRKSNSAPIITPYSELGHWLISICCYGADIHAYCIADEGKFREFNNSIQNRLLNEVEKLGLYLPAPVILQTGPLTTGQDIIYKIFEEHNSEAKKSIDNLKAGLGDFHLAIWVMPENSADNKALMELH